MALRIRKDGRVLCAAHHPAEPGDLYLDDNIHGYLGWCHGDNHPDTRQLDNYDWESHEYYIDGSGRESNHPPLRIDGVDYLNTSKIYADKRQREADAAACFALQQLKSICTDEMGENLDKGIEFLEERMRIENFKALRDEDGEINGFWLKQPLRDSGYQTTQESLQVDMMIYGKCPYCGGSFACNTSVVCTSIPPQYKWECRDCGLIEYHVCGYRPNKCNETATQRENADSAKILQQSEVI